MSCYCSAILLSSVLRCIRSNKKVLEVGDKGGGCRMSIDVGICQDEGGKLPYYMFYTERKHIHSLEIIPMFRFWSHQLYEQCSKKFTR